MLLMVLPALGPWQSADEKCFHGVLLCFAVALLAAAVSSGLMCLIGGSKNP